MSAKLKNAIGESKATATLLLDDPSQAGPAQVASYSGAAAGMPVTPWIRLEAAAAYIERYPLFIVAILSALYVYRIGKPIQKVFWFDELFTYYIAQSPGFSQFFDAVRHVDLNPPMIYALARLSQNAFGATEFATRLPSALSFFFGSLGLFYYLKSRIGALWSSAAVLLFWYTPFFRYATEARPYGLLLGFFALALVAYDAAILADPGRPRVAVAGIAVGIGGMMLSHVLAPVSILPFCLAELFRSVTTRRLDWAVWGCLLLPLLAAPACLPLILQVQRIYYPPAFQASLGKMLLFYRDAGLLYVFPGLPIAAALAMLASHFINKAGQASSRAVRSRYTGSYPDLAMAAALAIGPVLVNLAFMRTHSAFWERYCLTSALAICALEVVALAVLAHFSRGAALVAACVLFASILTSERAVSKNEIPVARLEQIRPELPFVAASGLTFLELDHYEKAGFLSRVYYLVDRPSAIKYAHATLMEGMLTLPRYFPIRSHVSTWTEFASRHRHFLVFGEIDYPEDWLLRKLIQEGATVTLLQTVKTQYKDSSIYEVILRP
ncbi:MAG: glycosyltransferase family 39 protein [Bryobacteraceae bacterium]|jgi:hypothetical protein